MWPEIEKVLKENRYELVLSGNEISERIDKNGIDQSLYQLISLNYLSIHNTNLNEISDDIVRLCSLQSLVLHTNKLENFNDSITKLIKLKLLDLSRNKITKISEEINNLINVTSLNFSYNLISDFPKLSKLNKLQVINLEKNNLTKFPELSDDLINLSEIKLNDNGIIEIPTEINKLPALKLLELNNNKIKILPGELSDCNKLKTLELKGNPISDRRLLKLIDQCRTKQILDYVKQHCAKKPKNKKNSEEKHDESKKDEESDENYKYSINIHYPTDEFRVVIENGVKSVREHFAGCIIDKITFNETNFKKFIQLQNRLHETICNKRNNATIATHDFNKLPPGNLVYTTKLPEELKILPLNRTQVMTGAELFTRLQNEAEHLRKEKKRNTYSGIHKYLYLIEGHPQYPCILNAAGDVISFPPITNSNITKIELTTTKMFVEVTSSVSIHCCKETLNELIKEMVGIFEQDLEVIQVKTTDVSGNLKVVYPAKTDLKTVGDDVKVTRN